MARWPLCKDFKGNDQQRSAVAAVDDAEIGSLLAWQGEQSMICSPKRIAIAVVLTVLLTTASIYSWAGSASEPISVKPVELEPEALVFFSKGRCHAGFGEKS